MYGFQAEYESRSTSAAHTVSRGASMIRFTVEDCEGVSSFALAARTTPASTSSATMSSRILIAGRAS